MLQIILVAGLWVNSLEHALSMDGHGSKIDDFLLFSVLRGIPKLPMATAAGVTAVLVAARRQKTHFYTSDSTFSSSLSRC